MPLKIDSEVLNNLRTFDAKLVGERLKQVRLDLSERYAQKVTQSHISDILALKDQNATLSNLEAGKGTIINFVKLLILYNNLGYNLSWIILPDNRFEQIHNDQTNKLQSLRSVDVNELLFEKKTNVKKALKSIELAQLELIDFLKP